MGQVETARLHAEGPVTIAHGCRASWRLPTFMLNIYPAHFGKFDWLRIKYEIIKWYEQYVMYGRNELILIFIKNGSQLKNIR